MDSGPTDVLSLMLSCRDAVPQNLEYHSSTRGRGPKARGPQCRIRRFPLDDTTHSPRETPFQRALRGTRGMFYRVFWNLKSQGDNCTCEVEPPCLRDLPRD